VKPAPKHSIVDRARRLPRKWAVVAAAVAVAAVLIPGIGYATASQASPAASQQAADSCRGLTKEILPAKGFITDPQRDQGGHFWWRAEPADSVCVGTVVEYVQYNVTATKTWQVIVYDTQNPNGVTVGTETFTLNAGWYLWPFRIRQAFAGLSGVCITAGDSFGVSCIHFVQ
jgi:hypothetical protein